MLKWKEGERMVMERDGEREMRSLPSSTMEIKCPIPGDGYSTTVSDLCAAIDE